MISVIICTYNRSADLLEAVKSVLHHNVGSDDEVLIIDNNSTDDTRDVYDSNFSNLLNVKYIKEVNVGLTFARNRGVKESECPWCLFLDDDGVYPPGFIDRIKYGIQNFPFKAWSGYDIPIYPDGKPVWMKDSYISVKHPLKKPSILNDTGFFFSGGSMVIAKEVFNNHGLFNEAIGAKGAQLRYGEETQYQLILREKGVPTGYDPELYFFHKIPAVKATLHFVLKQAFIKGYDRIVITGKPRNTLLDLFSVYVYVMIFGMKNFISLLMSPSYHPFTWVIDTIKKPTSYIGGVKATFDLKQNKDIWD